MASFNQCTFIGNLTKDCASKTLPSGTSVTEFSIAINHRYKTAQGEQRDEVTFLEVSFFGKAGEVIAQYFKKGDSILVVGRLKQENWSEKESGAKRSKHKLIGETFTFLPRGDGGKSEGDSDEREPAPAKGAAKPAFDDDDSVPF
jgi:single-strand DNA-binding protein